MQDLLPIASFTPQGRGVFSMTRFFAVATLALLPALSVAQSNKPAEHKTTNEAASQTRLVSYGEAKPASFSTTAPAPIEGGTAGVGYAQPSSFGERLRARIDAHICAPEGCEKPIGCGNFWTEKKFILGGCRQFFGTSGLSCGGIAICVDGQLLICNNQSPERNWTE